MSAYPNLLAFSTLGCPEWNLDTMIRRTLEYGYQAIELRGYLDKLDVLEAQPFQKSDRHKTFRQVIDAGLQFVCVGSSANCQKADLDYVKDYCELAHDLGALYVRVFGGELDPDLPLDLALQHSAEILGNYGDLAHEAGVAILLETHDSFSSGKRTVDLIQRSDSPFVFALWDLHHPYSTGECPVDSATRMRPHLRHIHIKDCVGPTCALPGEGDLPMAEMLDAAVNLGFSGTISLEWEKRWQAGIPDPEVAFPLYAAWIRDYFRQRDG